jgi:hypothetical protein
MRTILSLLLLAIAALPALASDHETFPPLAPEATLSKQLVGIWQGTYHQWLYKADGTWVRDPNTPGAKTGTWSIKNGHITRHWNKSDKTLTTQILELTGDTLQETDQGVLLVSHRVQQ